MEFRKLYQIMGSREDMSDGNDSKSVGRNKNTDDKRGSGDSGDGSGK